MKKVKKLVLLIAFLLISTIGISQSGWSTGRYYQYQGQSWTEWKTIFVGYNSWGQPVYRKICKQTNWYREYHSGYTYGWSNGRWRSYQYSGYSWYCNWSDWSYCY